MCVHFGGADFRQGSVIRNPGNRENRLLAWKSGPREFMCEGAGSEGGVLVCYVNEQSLVAGTSTESVNAE